MTLFYVPDILGGARSLLLGNLIEQQFLFTNNWPQGAATSVILTAIMAIMLWFYFRNSKLKDRQDLL
jgi:spermidine/putrescine transport system permease protein